MISCLMKAFGCCFFFKVGILCMLDLLIDLSSLTLSLGSSTSYASLDTFILISSSSRSFFSWAHCFLKKERMSEELSRAKYGLHARSFGIISSCIDSLSLFSNIFYSSSVPTLQSYTTNCVKFG